MKRILLTCLVFVGFLVLLPSVAKAQSSCENRSDNCPVDKYPTCQKDVGVCNAPGCSLLRFEGGRNIIDCAYPAQATPPSGPNTCGWNPVTGQETDNCDPGYYSLRKEDSGGRSCQCWPKDIPTPKGQPLRVNHKSCPVCPKDYAWTFSEQTCQHVTKTKEYTKPVRTVDCSGANNCQMGCGCGVESCEFRGSSQPIFCPGGIETALGCIPTKNTSAFIAWFLGWAIGIAGGIAFLLILAAGFIIMTASGKPEQLQHGRELLTAAISGLILIIFSVFLLQLIGVEILKIPGL